MSVIQSDGPIPQTAISGIRAVSVQSARKTKLIPLGGMA